MMNRRMVCLLVAASSAFAGCSNQKGSPGGDGPIGDPPPLAQNGVAGGADARSGNGAGASGGRLATPIEPRPVPIEAGVARLSGENTTVQFVGTHVGERPDPRTGVFTELSGTVQLDPASQAVQRISTEIQTASLVTPIANLTNHLKSPDFLDVREYPTIKFESTQIESGEATGEFNVTGDLTLMKTTRSIQFPIKATVSDRGLELSGEFQIDRTEFGMEGSQDRVSKEVALTVQVGRRPEVAAGASRRGGPRGGGGPGGFDPVAIFQSRDADGDGKLSGDEISDRMRQNLAEIDSDGDGSITLEEFQAQMARMRSRFGGGPGNGGERSDPPPRPESP